MVDPSWHLLEFEGVFHLLNSAGDSIWNKLHGRHGELCSWLAIQSNWLQPQQRGRMVVGFTTSRQVSSKSTPLFAAAYCLLALLAASCVYEDLKLTQFIDWNYFSLVFALIGTHALGKHLGVQAAAGNEV